MSTSNLERIKMTLAEDWKEHETVIERNYQQCSESEIEYSSKVADMITEIVDGDYMRLITGYRWMCNMITYEELNFRRTGKYRNSSFDEVVRTVYNLPEIMGPYMDGLLLSQVIWSNHIRIGHFYFNQFIKSALTNRRHLEIGPGHGLFLALANEIKGELYGWDISQDSIDKTRSCLRKISCLDNVSLVRKDLHHNQQEYQFDDIVISEVLEHIEDPLEGLKRVHELLRPGGRAFISAPVNAPTIDHIYLFNQPEEIMHLVEDAGFSIEQTISAPASGYDEKTARRLKATISCGVIARKQIIKEI